MVDQNHVDVRLPAGVLRVQPVASHTFRVRMRPDDRFQEPALVRYGIVRRDWPSVDFAVQEADDALCIETCEATFSIDKDDGRATLFDSEGSLLLREVAPPRSAPGTGFSAEFELVDGERLYGLGDVTRERIEKRGHRAMLWVENCSCYIPIPHLMSSRGWAILLNTSWRHFFDVGSTAHDRVPAWV